MYMHNTSNNIMFSDRVTIDFQYVFCTCCRVIWNSTCSHTKPETCRRRWPAEATRRTCSTRTTRPVAGMRTRPATPARRAGTRPSTIRTICTTINSRWCCWARQPTTRQLRLQPRQRPLCPQEPEPETEQWERQQELAAAAAVECLRGLYRLRLCYRSHSSKPPHSKRSKTVPARRWRPPRPPQPQCPQPPSAPLPRSNPRPTCPRHHHRHHRLHHRRHQRNRRCPSPRSHRLKSLSPYRP